MAAALAAGRMVRADPNVGHPAACAPAGRIDRIAVGIRRPGVAEAVASRPASRNEGASVDAETRRRTTPPGAGKPTRPATPRAWRSAPPTPSGADRVDRAPVATVITVPEPVRAPPAWTVTWSGRESEGAAAAL